MMLLPHSTAVHSAKPLNPRHGERGAALAIAILMMVLLSAIALGVLAVVQVDSKIAGSDLKRTEACYASAAAMEIMTNNFSALFTHTSRPTQAQLDNISDTLPTELTSPTNPANVAYTFPEHELEVNAKALAAMGTNKTVTIPYGPFNGLIAGLKPYTLTTTAQSSMAQCKLTRDMNNYLIPLFQFGMFSDKDIELHPGPDFTFNGRVHANGNLYVNGSVKFLDKVTIANELVYDVLRNGSTRTGATVSMRVGAFNVPVTKGSMNNGPNLTTATATPLGQRGYFPGSPNGTINTSWDTTSVAAATGAANRFGGQLLTRTTGAAALKLPLQLDGNPTRELIKRMMPNDSPDSANPSSLRQSRYHSKAQIRILIDDEIPSTTDASGIPSGQGVTLSTFDPIPLPNTTPTPSPTANGGGRALWRITDGNTSAGNSYTNESATSYVRQQQDGTPRQADTVRGVKPEPTPELKNITAATYTTPIRITSNAHGYATGDRVVIYGVNNITNANNSWTITKFDNNRFDLDGSTRNGSAGTTGTVYSYTALFNSLPKSANGTVIASGAGITGRVLIQIVDVNGVARDVTREILSMGMTQGEPNAIVTLQRPLWAAFTQGSRDASTASPTPNPSSGLTGDSRYANNLVDILTKTHIGAQGAIRSDSTYPTLDTTNGYLTDLRDTSGQPLRFDLTPSLNLGDWGTGSSPSSTWLSNGNWNAIVPINVYNMREGHLTTSITQNAVYERGITSVIEVNMRNLARWMDGVYDQNLLASTDAVSANIAHPDGYIVYVSDRRGDKVKSMVDSSGATINSTNGMVDNVDIYGPNGTMDAGEDVQNKGVAVGGSLAAAGLKDTTELPDPGNLTGTSGSSTANRFKRAISVAAWSNPNNYFRRSVRLYNAEDMQITGATGKLSSISGITVATENLVYIWGNYNTTGINQSPAAGVSSLNDPAAASRYTGNQVPASIVADAFFPISKTWFDSTSALYPDTYTSRRADRSMPAVTAGTAVRAGIIAGNNLAALDGNPDAGNGNDSRLNGGMHNFPRFLEDWLSDDRRWNFVGSFIPLYYSTQALGQWWYITSGNAIYAAPERNWAFDTTFLNPDRLPPGTPMFQYIAPTAFRQVL